MSEASEPQYVEVESDSVEEALLDGLFNRVAFYFDVLRFR